MSKKADKTIAVSSTAAAAATKGFSSSSLKKENGNTQSNSKCHPKTLDIQSAPSSKKMMIFTNGHNGANGLIAKGDKRTIASNNQKPPAFHSSRRSENCNSKENQKHQQQQQQTQKISPTSTTSTSSSSSSSSSSPGAIHPSQFATICREVAQIRDEHVAIRKSLSEKEGELGKTRSTLRNIAQERDYLRNKVSELEQILKHSPEMYSQVAAYLSSGNGGLITTNQNSRTTSTTASSNPGLHNNHSSVQNSCIAEVIPTNRNRVSQEQSTCSEICPISSPRVQRSSNNIQQQPHQHQYNQQQTQKLTLSSSRPEVVCFSPSMKSSSFESPRKCSSNVGNEGNSKRGSATIAVGGREEMQKTTTDLVSLPITSSSSAPSSPPANINSQESHHQLNNNNSKKILEKQQQQQHSIHNYNTKPSHNKEGGSENKSKSIYSHEQQQTPQKMGQVPLSAPPFPYSELQNGNSRNENGNDPIPANVNGNNNNNHLKNVYSGGGGGGGNTVGGGYHHNHNHLPQQQQQPQYHLSQSGITGLELMLLGPDCSTKVVEHLVHPLAIESSVREIQHTMVLKGTPLNGDRLREVEIEIDRLNSRIDHLRSQNDVLTLNLEDAKSHADRLTVLLGKYESNNVALQLALRYSDQMTDAYEVLAALLETEMGQALANLHAKGHLHLICSPTITANTSTNNRPTSGVLDAAPGSGNNNNSNDNSPSEHIPPAETINRIGDSNATVLNHKDADSGKQFPKSNSISDNSCVGLESVAEGENDDSGHSSDNNIGATSTTEGENMTVIPPSPNQVSTSNKINSLTLSSPHSPSSAQSSNGMGCPTPSSSKSMILMEQAHRNRLVAERAARFLLSQFSHSCTTVIAPSPPTARHGSTGNNNSSYIPSSNPFLLHSHNHQISCQSHSTTASIISSSPSATSNLSNISIESDGAQDQTSLISPTAEKIQEPHHQRQQLPPSTIITVEKDGGGGGMTPNNTTEMTSTVKEESTTSVTMMMMMTTSRSSTAVSSGSPTTTTSSTFRAPSLSPSPSMNGNERTGECTSIIPSLLPYLGAQNTFPSSENLGNGSSPSSNSKPSMETFIRNLISSLKKERDSVKQTVVMELESESLESLTPSPKPSTPYNRNNNNSSNGTTPTTAMALSPADARKLDLETAVLMQELMAMKEERAELRAQLFLVEKEKDSIELRLRSHESQEDAYKARINYLKSEIMDYKSLFSSSQTVLVDTYHQQDNRNRNDIMNTQQQQNNNGNNRNLETALINNNNNNQNVNWEREALLKKRIHELATTLEKVTIGSELREKENEEMINELNRANGILMQTLDAAKKKYQNRIKKMEDQILYISERHVAQMKLFGERLPASGGFGGKYHM